MTQPSLLRFILLGWSLVLLAGGEGFAERVYLHRPLTHLRSGNQREWNSFPERAEASRLVVKFEADANDAPWTLGIRRVDVKEGWQALLNGKRLGRLFSDENDMEEVWELPPGAVKQGANVFVVEPTDQRIDDVRIGQVWLERRAKATVFNESTLILETQDDQGRPLPCRFTILNQDKSLTAHGAASNNRLAVRSGVVYTLDGRANVGLAPGQYTIYCGRGFEYSLGKLSVVLGKEERTRLRFKLRRVVDTSGLASVDTHVHTFEVSRHGDASLVERMITLAGEGIDVAVATDHNVHVDYRPLLRKLGADPFVTSIIGNEVTTKHGHFNVFPATATAKPSNHKAESWEKLFESIYSTPNVRVAILNHPRDVHSGFTPFAPENMIAATGKRLDNRRLQANGMELINSAALQSDPMPALHNWMALLNRGHRIAAVGSSDSHEVSRKIVGQGRSYVRVDDREPGKISTDEVVSRFVDGRVLTSMGLLTELFVNQRFESGDLVTLKNNDKLTVEVRVQGPAWTRAERVELYMNGRKVRELKIPRERQNLAGRKVTAKWELERPQNDVHLVAVATGPGVRGLYWPIAKPYQPTSKTWNSYVFGASGAVRVDADGDGFQTARDYATSLVRKHERLTELLKSLADFDHAVAIFTAEAWLDSGSSLEPLEAQAALRKAAPRIREAFLEYQASLRESLRAQALR